VLINFDIDGKEKPFGTIAQISGISGVIFPLHPQFPISSVNQKTTLCDDLIGELDPRRTSGVRNLILEETKNKEG